MSRDDSTSLPRTAPPSVPRELASGVGHDPLPFLLRITRDYGDVVQFPTAFGQFCLVNHPDQVRTVLHDGAFVRVSLLKMGFGEGLLSTDGPYWRSQRRRMQPAFHHQCIESFAAIVGDEAARLVETWRPLAGSGEALDVSAEMNLLTLRIIGKALFGVDFAPVAAEISAAITTMLDHLKQLSFFVPTQMITRKGDRLFQQSKQTLDDMIYGIIRERRRSERRHDLLDLLLDGTGTEAGLTDQQVRDEFITMFIAGHETTANMLSWTWQALSTHPDVETRFHREVDGLLSGRDACFQDVAKLPYTAMLMQESMRLYPPVLLIYRRVLADQEVGEFVIPAGTTVGASPYTTHRHPAFWEDPERFDPERFTAERHSKRPFYAYFPFGGGPHRCVGNVFAMMEGALILATIARSYSLRLVDGRRAEADPFITLRLRDGLPMTLASRHEASRHEASRRD
jgi:cytochrome P450